ncbi:glycosyltransferase BC10-like [Phragmites australis]|uniref:glycosyltransferase BC10-like n=1 Tax=Phragmites australis TaxID=29695 RepID=UPI002D770BA8|nr:glycosyltransferase BC10-like [Phragmites australis]
MTSPATTTYTSPFVLSVLLLLSIPVVFLLAPRLLPPKTLPAISDADESDDLALFRRAILSSSTATPTPSSAASYFFRRRPAPKVAFLFLTNSDLVFSPLWEKFFRGHHHLFNLYVHADPYSVLELPPTPSFRGRFVPAKATQRASPTLISAARRLLATALLDDPSNQFFALLSQSCIPLHPFPTLYNALVSDNAGPHGRHRSFIEIKDNIDNDSTLLHDRYYARGDDVMLPEVPYDQFRAGSQFFVLIRRHAIMVVRDMRLWKKFKQPCLIKRRDSCYPEEHYFPTLLDMQDPEGCTKYTLTRVNWTDSVAGHPHTYRPGEVSASLIRELRKSNGIYSYMFARKFAPECLEPLMEIADSVILHD